MIAKNIIEEYKQFNFIKTMEIKDFEYLLCVGKSVLNNTCNHIQKLFFSKEMCLYEYICDGKTDKGLEIIIDDTVLVCVFDNNNCIKSILYFDKLDDLIDYVRYCDKNFEYDEQRKIWILPNNYLSLFFPDENTGRFGFIQISKES